MSGIGGAETFIKQTLTHCNKSLFENHYLCFRPGPLFDFLKSNGASVFLLNSPPRLSHINDRNKVSAEIQKIINQFNIQLVHSTSAYTALFVAWPCYRMSIKHVWFQHGPPSGWMDRLAALLPNQGIITNSHFTSAEQRRLEAPLRFFISRKLPLEKILLGTDVKKASSAEAQQYRNTLLAQNSITQPSTVLIAILCRLQSLKGVDLLLEALEILKQKKLKNDFFCCIWGEAFKGDAYFNSLKNQIVEKALPAQLLGPAPDVSLCLSAVDIVVSASVQPESFGLTLIEGMMVGAVPVAPNEGGPLEIIQHGYDGLHFIARDPESLARELETLIEDENLRLKLATQAQKSAELKYQAKRAIQQLESFHSKVLSS